MTYLLDVNALVALGFESHLFHEPVSAWVRTRQPPALATCSITELGFVRVLSQTPAYSIAVVQARELLAGLQTTRAVSFRFIADDSPISNLPRWVRTPKQITDGHLLHLAQSHGAQLATLDRGIPGAFLIPA